MVRQRNRCIAQCIPRNYSYTHGWAAVRNKTTIHRRSRQLRRHGSTVRQRPCMLHPWGRGSGESSGSGGDGTPSGGGGTAAHDDVADEDDAGRSEDATNTCNRLGGDSPGKAQPFSNYSCYVLLYKTHKKIEKF